MPFKVQVGPPQIAIHQGQTVLITEQDGQIAWPSEKGLYYHDTRLISAWAVYANGAPWVLLNGGAITYYAARIFLTNGDFLTQDGKIAARTLALVVSREIDGGMHEDLDVTNYGTQPVRFNLEIALALRFRRYVRGQIRTHRPPRTDQHHVERHGADPVQHLSQRRFHPFGGDHRGARQGRSMPTAG